MRDGERNSAVRLRSGGYSALRFCENFSTFSKTGPPLGMQVNPRLQRRRMSYACSRSSFSRTVNARRFAFEQPSPDATEARRDRQTSARTIEAFSKGRRDDSLMSQARTRTQSRQCRQRSLVAPHPGLTRWQLRRHRRGRVCSVIRRSGRRGDVNVIRQVKGLIRREGPSVGNF